MTRALLIAVGVLLLLCGLGAWQLKVAYKTIGEQTLAIEQANRTAEDNKIVFDTTLRAKDVEIEGLARARQLSEQAAVQSLKNEAAARVRIGQLERSLREAIANDVQSTDWGAQRIPDAVIDGMHNAASAGKDRRDDESRP